MTHQSDAGAPPDVEPRTPGEAPWTPPAPVGFETLASPSVSVERGPDVSKIGRRVARAAAGAGFGYALGLALCNAVVLGLVGAMIAGGLADSSFSDGLPVGDAFPAGDASDAGVEGYVVSVFLLLAMALLGALKISWPGAGQFDVLAFPLTVTAVIALAIAGWTAGREARTAIAPSVRERWVDVALTGLVLGAAGALTALTTHATFPTGIGATPGTLGASPWGTLAGGTVVGAVASAVGHTLRRRATGRGWVVVPERLGVTPPVPVRRATGALVVAAVPVTIVLLAVAFSVLALTNDVPTALLLMLVAAPNVVALALGFGGFGGVTTGLVAGWEAEAQTQGLFHPEAHATSWLLLLVPLLGVVVVALRLHLARGVDGRPVGWHDAWATPVVLSVVTLAAVAVTGVRATGTYDVPYESPAFSAWFALAPWTTLVAAVWAALAEALSRTLAPGMAAALPPRLVAVLTPRVAVTAPVRPDPAAADPTVPAPAPRLAPSSTGSGAQHAPTLTGAPGPDVPSSPVGLKAGARPVDPRLARRILGIVAGAVLLLVSAVVARGVVASTVFAPEKPVEQYLAALEAGDADSALALADPDVAHDERALLTSAVYEQVEARPAGARVVEVARDRGTGTAAVTVTWDQDGVKTEHVLSVRRTGSVLGLFDEWELVAPPVTAVELGGAFGQETPTVVVNGVEVDVRDPSSPSFVALPGRWEVTLPDAGPYLRSSTATLLVTAPGSPARPAGGPDDLPLRYSLTDDALDAAVEQARVQLDGCLASTSARPDGCPFYDWAYGASEAQDVTWALATEPTFEAEEIDGTTLRVHVRGGVATTSGTLPAQPDRLFGRKQPEPYSGKVDLDYAMQLTVEEGELVLGESSGWW